MRRDLEETLLKIIAAIPLGEVRSYSGIYREATGVGGGGRRVAGLLRRHPAAEDLPWHRVVGAGNRVLLDGRSGAEQERRLRAEGWRIRRSGRSRPTIEKPLCFYGVP